MSRAACTGRSSLVEALVLAALWVTLWIALLGTGAELGEARTLSVGSYRVAVLYFHGPIPAPTLLVVTHGGLSSKESLMGVCWAARRRGADCVAVDALGHGASSAQPSVDTVQRMRDALRVAPALGAYQKVRFLGHSMGGYLGRGTPYACGQSVALGQTTDCNDERVVWGTLHRSLGLSERWYLLSHVLESWTPWVIERALDLVLPHAPAGRSALPVQIALSWFSFAVAVAAGIAFARAFRQANAWPPALRAASLIVAWLARLFGARSARLGAWLGTLFPLAAASALFFTFRSREMGGLMALLPIMTIPLMPWVWLWERASRSRSCEVLESALFTSTLLACFVTLLLPAFA